MSEKHNLPQQISRALHPVARLLTGRPRWLPGWLLHWQSSESTALVTLALSVGLASGVGIWLYRAAVEGFHWLFVDGLADRVLARGVGKLSLVLTLALAGAIVGWLMERFVGHERHHGVAGVIEAVALGGGRLRYRRMPFKALASALSLGAGASVGPEDPSVQIGANLGSFFGQRLHLAEERVQLLVAAGAASAIAAAFEAPIAGVFFALEVILNGEFSTGSFGVVVLAAVVSSVFTAAAPLREDTLGILNYTLGSPLEMPFYIALGLLLGVAAALFIRLNYWQQDFWHTRVPLPRPLKTALAGALVGAVGLFLPEILGAGREPMRLVLNGEDAQYTLLLLLALGLVKLLMTTVSLGGGFVGGIFAPTLFVGTMLGGAFGRAVNAIVPVSAAGSAQAYAIAGMAAVMAGAVRAPITAILLVFELTNDYRLILPIMLTTVVCVFVAERIEPLGIYVLGLKRKGVTLPQGRDVDLMQSVRVAEAMRTPAPTLPETASLGTLRDALRRYQTRALCVVDGAGLLAGIVTLSDLQQAYERPDAAALTVGDICTRQVETVQPDDPLWKAIRCMGQHDVGRLPVVRPGTRELAGILSRHGIVTAYNAAIARKRTEQHVAEQVRLHALTGAQVIDLHIREHSPLAGRSIREIAWPAESLVAAVRRSGRLIVPHGDTRLRPGDWLTMVAAPDAERELAALFGGNGDERE